MSPKICPCMAMSTGVKIVVFGDAVCSIVSGIRTFFAVVGLIFLSDEKLKVDMGQRIIGVIWAIFLRLLAAAQLWAASVLYKYTKGSNQNNRGLWQWLLVTTVIIIWFLFVIKAIRDLKGGVSLFFLVIIVYKFFGVLVVAAFKKSLTGEETSAAYSAANV